MIMHFNTNCDNLYVTSYFTYQYSPYIGDILSLYIIYTHVNYRLIMCDEFDIKKLKKKIEIKL